MAVNKVVYGNTTLVDLTEDTVTPATLAKGATAHDKSGDVITGTMEGGGSVLWGSDKPASTLGSDGDIYVKTV